MSFWDIGENLNTTGKFEVGGGEPIPANTALKCMISSAKWGDYEGSYYIDLEWTVLEGDYKNRKVFQKIRVKDDDPKKRARAVQMLAAIDANCGGGLLASRQEPTDESLAQNLAHKIMWIKVGVWEIEGKKGNWVQAVSGGGAGAVQTAPAEVIQQHTPAQPSPVAADLSADVPF